MQNTFLTRTRVWLGGIALLGLAVAVPITPAMAVPVSYDLSGPLTGNVVIDVAAIEPYIAWDITFVTGAGTFVWNSGTDSSVVANYDGGNAFFYLSTTNVPGGQYLLFNTSLAPNYIYNFQIGESTAPFNSYGGGTGPLGVPAVPESSSILLLAAGLLGLAAWQWKRQGTTHA